MYAIISAGGKQYKVAPGMLLDVEKHPGEAGKTLRLTEVLAVRTDSGFTVGRPHVEGAAVIAQVENHLKGPKVINFKFKRRKGYHRKIGHRQKYTRLKVLEIISNGTH